MAVRAVIEFRQVKKTYGDRIHALSEVDFHVGKGEFVFVVGPSGAGKSTLLRLIYREEVATEGQVIVDGRDVGRMKPRALPYLRRNVGVVFQDFKLLPARTLWENVAFPLEVTGARPHETRRRVAQVLDLVGLRGRSRAYPAELSGGEQQRACLARAMANSPGILLADEPTGNLDPATGAEVMHGLLSFSVMGTTVVVATHARPFVDSIHRRVVRLERGRVVSDEQNAGYGGPHGAGGGAS